MDIQVQELIDKIKQDGIENASKAAQSLRDEAEVQAQKIVEKAKAESTKLVEAALAMLFFRCRLKIRKYLPWLFKAIVPLHLTPPL